MNELEQLQTKFSQLLDSQRFVQSELDYNIVARHISYLEQLNNIGSSAISVFDMFKRKHLYMSSNFESILGWEIKKVAEDEFTSDANKVHYDDAIQLFKAGIYFTSFILGLPGNKRKEFKMIADYRVIGKDEKYVRVLEQQSALELDRNGNIWLALSFLDLSPYSDIETTFRCRTLNHKTGELYKFPDDAKTESDILSLREKDVLGLIAKGLISREIGDMLFISVNTVNTHRQNIIRKLNVKNTSEAIQYAMSIGILGRSD